MALAEDIRASIYEEHLDEASFLYEQRARYLGDPELSFDDVAELDARLEAHLDGLVLGGTLARALCQKQLEGEDPGGQYAALRVLCRLDAQAVVFEALQRLMQGEPATRTAAAEALSADAPEHWALSVERTLQDADALTLALWSRVIGYRRWPLGASLLAAASGLQAPPAQCAWALGELREHAAEPTLLGWLWRGEPALVQAAAIALLKCGSRVGVGEIEALATRGAIALAVPLSLSAQARYSLVQALVKQADTGRRQETLCALALLGDPRAIPGLVQALAEEELATTAAAALFLLTGAALTETVEVQPPTDEQLDDDLIKPDEAPAEDETPVRPSTELRLCRDAAQWQAWLSEREQELGAHSRLRMGGAVSLASTVAALSSTALPLCLRQWLADELLIGSGIELRYRPDLPIAQQRALLGAMLAGPKG